MGGQAIERREIMRLLAMASVAASFPGFRRWSFAHGPQPAQSAGGAYQPLFFRADEFQTVEQLAELVIPADESAGAAEAGVAEFIDFMVAHDRPLQYRFRYGLNWLDAHSVRLLERPFRELTPAQQTSLLEPLAYRERWRPREEEGRALFQLMRDYTVMGYYTSRIGLEELGYPGLQTVYPEFPGCPDPSDPDHHHAPQAASGDHSHSR